MPDKAFFDPPPPPPPSEVVELHLTTMAKGLGDGKNLVMVEVHFLGEEIPIGVLGRRESVRVGSRALAMNANAGLLCFCSTTDGDGEGKSRSFSSSISPHLIFVFHIDINYLINHLLEIIPSNIL